MSRLAAAMRERTVFAPFTLRLSMRLEQVHWEDIAGSVGEGIFLLRSAQRLFGLDGYCAWFDTWLEAEAAGVSIQRDEFGRATGNPVTPLALPTVDSLLASVAISRTLEIVRRLTQEQGTSLTFAPITAPATFLAHLGNAAGATSEYAQSISVALATAYCEAGADALVLLQEEDSPDAADIASQGALFNLAGYYARPVIAVFRHSLSAVGTATLDRLTEGLWVSASQNGAGVSAVSETDPDTPRARTGKLVISRWDVAPETEPDVVLSWRSRVNV